MEVQIIEHIEFSEDKCEDVVLIGEIISSRQDGTWCEDISWDKTMSSDEENMTIELVTLRPSIYERLFNAYDQEMEERKIESAI